MDFSGVGLMRLDWTRVGLVGLDLSDFKGIGFKRI